MISELCSDILPLSEIHVGEFSFSFFNYRVEVVRAFIKLLRIEHAVGGGEWLLVLSSFL